MTPKRIAALFFSVFAVSVLAPGAFAQAWPNRPIRLIIPWPAGGPADSLARTVTLKMSEALGQACCRRWTNA